MATPTNDLCPELPGRKRRKCPSCESPMIVTRRKKSSDVMWLCPAASCHEAIAIDQNSYWTYIARRNERNVVGRYDGPLVPYDLRLRDQPSGAGPAFVRGYAANRPNVRLPKQSDFD